MSGTDTTVSAARQPLRGGALAASFCALLALAMAGGPVHADGPADRQADRLADTGAVAPDVQDTQPDSARSDSKDMPQSRWATPRYPGVKVFIDAAGNVFIDDEPASTELLHEAFSGLDDYNGVVWYNRENPAQEPQGKVAEAVDEVIGILSGYKLAVELFEAGFPDPDAHWQTLDNPPPRFEATSAPPEAEKPKR